MVPAAEQGVQALNPIAGAHEIALTRSEYSAALGHVLPSHALDPVSSYADSVGHAAARAAVLNPAFVAALQAGNMTLAGTLCHSAAAGVIRAGTNAAPTGWTPRAELTIQSGRGGSRADVFLTGPAGAIVEIDWKTTWRSGLSHASRSEMTRHAGQIATNIGGTLTRQESRSWMDYVRSVWPGAPLP